MFKTGLSLVLTLLSFSGLTRTLHIDGIYGEDNRYESYERLATYPLAQSVAAMIHTGFFHFKSNGKVEVNGVSTLGQEYNLCSNVRFANQPVIASCSGALIAEDLILTAGHCFDKKSDCQDFFWVFDYEMTRTGNVRPFQVENIYSCTSIEERLLNNFGDYAVIRLDRPVRGRKPLKVAAPSYRVTINEPLFMMGYPSGLPLKTTENGKVQDWEKNSFITNLDAYAANSGSPVFSQRTQEIVGVLISGGEDYVVGKNQCYINAQYADHAGNEEVQSVHIIPRNF